MCIKLFDNGQPLYIKYYVTPYTTSANTRHRNPQKIILATVNDKSKFHKSSVQLALSFSCTQFPELGKNCPCM
jgi:hypothetical protein